MAEDRAIINLIVKECCGGIEYDEMSKQYSFALKSNCDKIWEKIRIETRSLSSQFIVSDFNEILAEMQRAHSLCNRELLSNGIENGLLMQGESMEIKTDQGTSILTKMGPNQYLSDSGFGMTFPSGQFFRKGLELQTSEGYNLGCIREVLLRTPTYIHIAMGTYLLPGYYKKNIKSSLWPLYQIAEEARNSNWGYSSILDIAKDLGIGILPMITIINSYKPL